MTVQELIAQMRAKNELICNHILFVDTETSGLPKDTNRSFKDIYNWPQIHQIAWIIYSKDGDLISKKNYSTKTSETGDSTASDYIPRTVLPIHEILPIFNEDLNTCSVIVGHNISFDVNVILCELYRLGLNTEKLEYMQQFCTMKNSVNVCGFSSYNGDRFPKLQELYTKLFHAPFENAHDAYCDIKSTADCYWKLFNDKFLNIEDFPYLISLKVKKQIAKSYSDEADQLFMSLKKTRSMLSWQKIREKSEKILLLYQKAATLGHAFSLFRIGELYEQQLLETDYISSQSTALEWYRKAMNNRCEDQDYIFSSFVRVKAPKYELSRVYNIWLDKCDNHLSEQSTRHIENYIEAFQYGWYGANKNISKAIEVCEKAIQLNRPLEVNGISFYKTLALLKKNNDNLSGYVENLNKYLQQLENSNISNIWRMNDQLLWVRESLLKELFDGGNGIARDLKRSKELIEELPSSNFIALYYIGRCYEEGVCSYEKDYTKAFQSYEKAWRDYGYISTEDSIKKDILRRLGQMYLYGTGCKKSKKNARKFLNYWENYNRKKQKATINISEKGWISIICFVLLIVSIPWFFSAGHLFPFVFGWCVIIFWIGSLFGNY